MDKKHKPWVCLICLIAMETVDEDHCKCPKCGTEVWYDYKEESDDDIGELMQESYTGHSTDPQFSIMSGQAAKGGGGSNGGKSRKKQLMQKPTTTELYNRLVK